MKRKKAWPIGIAIIGLIAVILLFSQSPDSGESVVRVGNTLITKGFLERREAVLKIYSPERDLSGTPEVVLADALRQVLDAEILDHVGSPQTLDDFRKDYLAMKKGSLFPEKLQSIRDIYDSEGDFLREYVRLVKASQKLHFGHFRQNPQFWGEAYQLAQQSLEKALEKPNQFADLADSEKVEFLSQKWNPETGEIYSNVSLKKKGPAPGNKMPENVKKRMDMAVAHSPLVPYLEKLQKIESGQVLPEVINQDQALSIVRRVKRGEDEFLEVLSFKKNSPEDLWWKEAGKIKFEVFHDELIEKLKENVSWMERLSL